MITIGAPDGQRRNSEQNTHRFSQKILPQNFHRIPLDEVLTEDVHRTSKEKVPSQNSHRRSFHRIFTDYSQTHSQNITNRFRRNHRILQTQLGSSHIKTRRFHRHIHRLFTEFHRYIHRISQTHSQIIHRISADRYTRNHGKSQTYSHRYQELSFTEHSTKQTESAINSHAQHHKFLCRKAEIAEYCIFHQLQKSQYAIYLNLLN